MLNLRLSGFSAQTIPWLQGRSGHLQQVRSHRRLRFSSRLANERMGQNAVTVRPFNQPSMTSAAPIKLAESPSRLDGKHGSLVIYCLWGAVMLLAIGVAGYMALNSH